MSVKSSCFLPCLMTRQLVGSDKLCGSKCFSHSLNDLNDETFLLSRLGTSFSRSNRLHNNGHLFYIRFAWLMNPYVAMTSHECSFVAGFEFRFYFQRLTLATLFRRSVDCSQLDNVRFALFLAKSRLVERECQHENDHLLCRK